MLCQCWLWKWKLDKIRVWRRPGSCKKTTHHKEMVVCYPLEVASHPEATNSLVIIIITLPHCLPPWNCPPTYEAEQSHFSILALSGWVLGGGNDWVELGGARRTSNRIDDEEISNVCRKCSHCITLWGNNYQSNNTCKRRLVDSWYTDPLN